MKRIVSLILCFILLFSSTAFASDATLGDKLYANVEIMADYLINYHIDALPDDEPIKQGLSHIEKTDADMYAVISRYVSDVSDSEAVKAGLISLFNDRSELYVDIVNAMFQSYDKNSYFMNVSEYEYAYDYTTYMGGVGITLEIREDGAYITEVVADGAAEAVGVLAGDKILSAGGVSVAGFTAEMIGEIIRGPIGTTVELSVLRDGAEHSFSLVRYAIANSFVSASLVTNDVAYMEISHFQDITSYLEFTMLCNTLSEMGVKTLILDLRNNMGGALDVAVNTIERLIPDKGVSYLEAEISNPSRTKTYTSMGIGQKFGKMVILVNENTASSAEIVAGSLRDLGYATLVGTQTYGKGTGQFHSQVSPGEVAVVTDRRFYLPTSGSYDGVGLIPDIKVELGYEYYHLPKLSDFIKNRDVYITSSTNVLALEERLCALGYFSGKPDNVADGATFLAVNRFQYDNGIRETRGYCDYATLVELDRAAIALDGTRVYVDTQLARAISIAKTYARNQVMPKPVDIAKITFGR